MSGLVDSLAQSCLYKLVELLGVVSAQFHSSPFQPVAKCEQFVFILALAAGYLFFVVVYYEFL